MLELIAPCDPKDGGDAVSEFILFRSHKHNQRRVPSPGKEKMLLVNVGDRVKCLTCPDDESAVGRKGTIIKTTENHQALVEFDITSRCRYFELEVFPPQLTVIPGFKVGDRVRCVSCSENPHIAGRVGNIMSIGKYIPQVLVEFDEFIKGMDNTGFKDGHCWAVHEYELVLAADYIDNEEKLNSLKERLFDLMSVTIDQRDMYTIQYLKDEFKKLSGQEYIGWYV